MRYINYPPREVRLADSAPVVTIPILRATEPTHQKRTTKLVQPANDPFALGLPYCYAEHLMWRYQITRQELYRWHFARDDPDPKHKGGRNFPQPCNKNRTTKGGREYGRRMYRVADIIKWEIEEGLIPSPDQAAE